MHQMQIVKDGVVETVWATEPVVVAEFSPAKSEPAKLFVMPKPEPEYEDLITEQLDVAFQMRKRIKNMAILVHLDDGRVLLLDATEPDIDPMMFIRALDAKALEQMNRRLSPSKPNNPKTIA